MSKNSRKKHIQLFKSHFELACLFGTWICATDLVWLAHDIYTNGLNVMYVVVGTGLTIGLMGTIYCLLKHHRDEFKQYCKRKLAEHQRSLVAKAKAQRIHNNKHPSRKRRSKQ